MISSLFADVFAWFRGRGPYGSAACTERSPAFAAPPCLEPLEDRCLLSSTTTVPPLSDIPSFIAAQDIMFATQTKGSPTVVFLGDSISWFYAYGTGAAVWSSLMAPLGMANYGVSGQTTQSLLFQLSIGQLAGINPAVVVLDIGANNLLQNDSPQATAAGVLADVAMIHGFLPLSRVVVLGILPGEQSPSSPYRAEGEQTNQLLSQMLASDPQATFVNFGSIFLQPDGTISSSMMFDYLHPTELGYLELTANLLPVIEQTLFGALPTVTLPPLSLPSGFLTSSGGFQAPPPPPSSPLVQSP
jgi:lysophospholipase L1-like esterase